MTQQVSRFVAKTASGASVVLLAFGRYREVEDCSGPYRFFMGKSFTTEDGKPVKHLEQGKFAIHDTGELLTSTDPACPPFEH